MQGTYEKQISKREKLDMLTWNRRLKKAGEGCRANRPRHHGFPIVEPDAALIYLQSYAIRKDRSANFYRTKRKMIQFDMGGPPPTLFWVQDKRTGERVTDPAILEAVVGIVNDDRKWPYNDKVYRAGRKTKYGRAAVTFDKPGPGKLHRHSLGLPCKCDKCNPAPPKPQAPVKYAPGFAPIAAGGYAIYRAPSVR